MVRATDTEEGISVHIFIFRNTQEDIDSWYDRFVQVYHNEMSSKKNYYVAKKAWWCDELGELAKLTHKAEKRLREVMQLKENS